MLLFFGAGKADVTVKIKDADFMDLVSGKLTPQKVGYVYNLGL